MNDTDRMPFGKHKGREMQDVPAGYLVWLYENNKCNSQVRAYIVENLEYLRLEVKQNL